MEFPRSSLSLPVEHPSSIVECLFFVNLCFKKRSTERQPFALIIILPKLHRTPTKTNKCAASRRPLRGQPPRQTCAEGRSTSEATQWKRLLMLFFSIRRCWRLEQHMLQQIGRHRLPVALLQCPRHPSHPIQSTGEHLC